MTCTVTVQFSADHTLAKRGMGKDHALRKYLANRVRLRCDPYVPMQSGTLKNTAQVSRGGEFIVYPQPYAHYQYHGIVMAGRAPKHYTGEPVAYHGAPMRGKQWDKRMMADHAQDVVRGLAMFVGGKTK